MNILNRSYYDFTCSYCLVCGVGIVFEFVDDGKEESEEDEKVYLIPLLSYCCCTAAAAVNVNVDDVIGYEVNTVSWFDFLLPSY